MEHSEIATTLGRVHVTIDGGGPVMLMWPSLLMDGSLWSGQVEHFRSRFTTIAIDPPGHGRSEPLDRRFTFAECAHVIVQVLDHLSHERAHVLGNSWGGMVGGTFLAMHPERAAASVLMNATATKAARFQRLEYGGLLAAARALGGIKAPITSSVLKAFLGPTSLDQRPDVVERVRASVEKVDVASAAHAVRSVVPHRPDQRRLFARIEVPVLVVAGAEDATFPPRDASTMSAAIPGSELAVIDGAAHLAALEVPDVVNRLVDDFLDRHRA